MTINKISEIALFISYIKMFLSSNLYSFVPLFPKNRLMFPCSLRYFANVPLFPQTPGRASFLEILRSENERKENEKREKEEKRKERERVLRRKERKKGRKIERKS